MPPNLPPTQPPSQPPALSPALAGIASRITEILTLADTLDAEQLARAPRTLAALCRRLAQIAALAASVPPERRATMPEIGWTQWAALGEAIAADEASVELCWSAATALCPETLQWLRVFAGERIHSP